MKMTELKKKAEALRVRPGKRKKVELIQAIQKAEGNMSCFGHSQGHCDYTDCCFMEDCLKVKL